MLNMPTTNEKEFSTDVVELCAILQCLGYHIRSLDTSEGNISQDGGNRTIVINCQFSGLHVVLDSGSGACSCPVSNQEVGSGFWQISAVSGGKHHDKEFGSTALGTLPKVFRERLTMELRELVRDIRYYYNDGKTELRNSNCADEGDKSASMVELKSTPDKILSHKVETPRYRSLDALINNKSGFELPAPGALVKHVNSSDISDDNGSKEVVNKRTCQRQGTYTVSSRSIHTVSSTPGSIRRRNKTSSPIQGTSKVNVLDKLINAEKAAEDLRNKLSGLISEMSEEGKNESMTSLVLDVSKISLLKGPELSKNQFASSPNLSGLMPYNDDGMLIKSKLKRVDSASTSNIMANIPTPNKHGGPKSRLRKLSPNFFRSKKDGANGKDAKAPMKIPENKYKLNSLLRPKIVTPVRFPKPEASPNLSANKKKFSHVKSTIPKPTPKKE